MKHNYKFTRARKEDLREIITLITNKGLATDYVVDNLKSFYIKKNETDNIVICCSYIDTNVKNEYEIRALVVKKGGNIRLPRDMVDFVSDKIKEVGGIKAYAVINKKNNSFIEFLKRFNGFVDSQKKVSEVIIRYKKGVKNKILLERIL